MAASGDDTTQYRWPRPLMLRLSGVVTAALGTLWIVGIAIDVWVVSGLGATLYVVGLSGTAVVLVVALVLLGRPPLVVEMAPDRYRLHHLRGGGVATAQWHDVESAQTQSSSNGPLIVIQLKDGQRSLLPLTLLGARSVEAEREIHDRLSTGHGYRPLDT
jgi:hypothetical protein